MADFVVKQNDTLPTLDVAMEDAKGRPVADLTGATVVFHMRNTADNSVKVSGGSATILSASKAQVRYTFTAANTDTAGTFEGEFQATLSGGGVVSSPNDEYIDIEIVDDIA